MKVTLISMAFLFIVLLFVLFLVQSANAQLRRKRRLQTGGIRPEAKKARKKSAETTKMVIWICLANGFAWVWCSYILAYLDKVQIAESLSQVAVTEIIGVVLAYCIKSAIENLSKNNRWPDKTADTEPTDLQQ